LNVNQDVMNIAIGVMCSIFGWLLKTVWESVKDLQCADKSLAEKVTQIELLVAGSYIKRDEIQVLHDALFRKLDKIEDRVNRVIIQRETINNSTRHDHD
jgi:hypothetical protein